MIAFATMVAALAILAWRSGRSPADAASLGLMVFLAGGLVAAVLSNRVQRRVRAIVASLLCRFWSDRRDELQRLLAPLLRVGTTAEFLARLPRVTVSAARVEPVTVFALDDDGSQYVPVSSTLVPTPCVPVSVDDPLVRALRKPRPVHYLSGRPDDLENAPINAVNGLQVEECEATCVMPLRRDGALVAFMLCGGTKGKARLGLLSSGYLEDLGRRYTDLLQRCPDGDLTVTGRLATGPVATHRSVNA